MNDKQPAQAPLKPKGWFSRRHQTSAEHDKAREDYQANRGRKARQRRAAERHVLTLCGFGEAGKESDKKQAPEVLRGYAKKLKRERQGS